MTTPRDAGFSMPAEWAPHARCWMAWPCRAEAWGGAGLDEARRAYAEVAQAIARFEPVTMICRPDQLAQASLLCGPGIAVLPMQHDDSWTRDTGPTFLVDAQGGTLAGVTWRFNGWGEAYPDHGQDAQMARRVLEHLGVRRFASSMVMEGGGLHVDGEGTALVCTTSVLDPKRNPGMTRAEAEEELKAHLGVETVVWLPAGLADDETGGHVDNVACFARPGVVLALSTDDEADANSAGLAENQAVLRATTDARGRQLQVVPIQQPRALARAGTDRGRATLSYINFYLANGAVVMPSFDDPADAAAAKAIGAAFPDRKLVQVEALEIVQGGGGIHCITQQQPLVVPPAT